jgi:predicted MFS family arabinose efflux permease
LSSKLPAVQRATFTSVLAEPRFRILFGCRSLAIVADTLRIVALSILIFATTGSPLLAALTFGIGFAPQAIGGLLFGALSDRIRPRLLISAGYAAECVSAAILAFTEPPVWLMLVIIAVVACMTPVFMGAVNRLVSEVLTGDRYILGRSLWTTAASLAQLLGLTAGGVAATTLGPRTALAVSAGLHLTAFVVTRLRLPDFAAPATESASVLRQTMKVNRALFATKPIRQLLLAHWLPPAFAVGAESLIVVYVQVRGLPASYAGVLLACIPVGMIIGNLVVARLLVPGPRLAAPLVVLVGLPFVVFAANPHPVLLCALAVVTGTGFSYTLGIQKAFLAVVPADGRGQAFGLLSTGMQTLQGIGPACFGALAEIIHPSTAIAAAGGATVLTALWLWLGMRGGLELVETGSSSDQQGPVPQQTGLLAGGHLGDDRTEEHHA